MSRPSSSRPRSRALLDGRYNVSFEDLRRRLPTQPEHRVLLNFEAQGRGRRRRRYPAPVLDAVPEKAEQPAAVCVVFSTMDCILVALEPKSCPHCFSNSMHAWSSSPHFSLGVGLTLGSSSSLAAEQVDLVLRGGRIVDGCGTPWYRGDVAIRDGRIAAMGRLDAVAAGPTTRRHGPGRRPRVHRHDGPVGAVVPRGPAGRRQPADPGDHDDQRRRRGVGRPAGRNGGRSGPAGRRWPSTSTGSTAPGCR